MIDIERRGPIAIARLQHGKVNALDLELCEAIAACIEGERQSPTRALILTGQGSREALEAIERYVAQTFKRPRG